MYRCLERFKQYALQNHIDIVMFGHTHKPYIEIDEDVTVLNPGSVSYPRQSDHMPTFLIMEIDDEGEAHYGQGYYKSKFSDIKICQWKRVHTAASFPFYMYRKEIIK